MFLQKSYFYKTERIIRNYR